MLDTSPGLPEEVAFVGDGNLSAEIMDTEVVDNLVREVMHIDDDIVIAGGDQFREDVVQQRLAADGHERLGHRVCQGFQAGSQPRGKDHRFHPSVECIFLIVNHLHKNA